MNHEFYEYEFKILCADKFSDCVLDDCFFTDYIDWASKSFETCAFV